MNRVGCSYIFLFLVAAFVFANFGEFRPIRHEPAPFSAIAGGRVGRVVDSVAGQPPAADLRNAIGTSVYGEGTGAAAVCKGNLRTLQNALLLYEMENAGKPTPSETDLQAEGYLKDHLTCPAGGEYGCRAILPEGAVSGAVETVFYCSIHGEATRP